jgi:hypothetical protein
MKNCDYFAICDVLRKTLWKSRKQVQDFLKTKKLPNRFYCFNGYLYIYILNPGEKEDEQQDKVFIYNIINRNDYIKVSYRRMMVISKPIETKGVSCDYSKLFGIATGKIKLD